MLDDLKILHERDPHDLLGQVERAWGVDPELRQFLRSNYSAVVPTQKNAAKQIALDCIGKTPIIYHGPVMVEAARHWKLCFNVQAMHLAWTVAYPDNFEAELSGWKKQPIHKPFAIIDLSSSADTAEVTHAFQIAQRTLSGVRPASHAIELRLGSIEQEVACVSALGEFVSLYVAIASGVNPVTIKETTT